MPTCGRASGVFSTFTDKAGRVWLAPPGSRRPVSGAVVGAAVVVVGLVVRVVLDCARWFWWCLLLTPVKAMNAPPTPASTSATTEMRSTIRGLRRIGISENQQLHPKKRI